MYLLQRVYGVLHHYINFFQPVQKVVGKKQSGTLNTMIYDQAKTPYQRSLDWELVPESSKLRNQPGFALGQRQSSDELGWVVLCDSPRK